MIKTNQINRTNMTNSLKPDMGRTPLVKRQ